MAEALAGGLDEALEPPRRTALAPRTAMAALGASALFALVVPGSRMGLGLAAGAVCVLAAGSLGAWRARASWQVAVFSAAAALAAASLLRDASWLVLADLVAAFCLAAIALGSETTWRGAGRALAAVMAGLFSGPGAVVRGVLGRAAALGGPALAPLLRGGLLAAGLLTVFSLLFVSADGAFAHLFGELSPDLASLKPVERLAVGIAAVAVAGALALVAKDRRPPASAPEPSRRLAPVEWGLALGALAALFLAFVGVQFFVLFGGDGHVLETAGLTYAEYAREGFGQLLASALLVLGVIAAALRYCEAESRRQRALLRALLGAICLMSLVIVASGLHRLDLYVDAFGATRARLIAGFCSAWVAGILAMLAIALVRGSTRWLARGLIVFTAATLLGLTIVNPDGLVAERNVERFERTGSIDPLYNAGLSADAVPALAELPEPEAQPILEAQTRRLESDDGLWGLNVARERARAALAGS